MKESLFVQSFSRQIQPRLEVKAPSIKALNLERGIALGVVILPLAGTALAVWRMSQGAMVSL